MNLAKISGTIWATQKDPQMNNLKMLLIQTVDSDQKEKGRPVFTLYSVAAGSGEMVMYVTSSEAGIQLKNKPALCEATIPGIIDDIEVFN